MTTLFDVSIPLYSLRTGNQGGIRVVVNCRLPHDKFTVQNSNAMMYHCELKAQTDLLEDWVVGATDPIKGVITRDYNFLPVNGKGFPAKSP